MRNPDNVLWLTFVCAMAASIVASTMMQVS